MESVVKITPLTVLDVKGSFELNNGMFCVWGSSKEEPGCYAADIYKNKASVFIKDALVRMEHRIHSNVPMNSKFLKMLVDSMSHEF